LVVADMRAFTVGYSKNTQNPEVFSRQVLDVLPFFSKTRSEAIERAIKYIERNNGGKKVDKSSLYIPFLKFHPKWAEDNFTFRKLLDWKSNYLGFYMSKTLSVRQESITVRTEQTNEKKALIETAEKNLYEIIAYCKEKGYELLFVNTPHYLSPHEEERMNTIEDILEEEGIPYVNYDVVDESVYSLEEDFYNDGHVNYYGAEKFTADFAKYIDENYDLPDRRGDEDVSKDWDGVYDKIKKQIKKWEKKKRS
ncbi:MAG: hypothetical protein IKV88_06650, partial [Clostridia bacterium]|nr:hypothetical protein [Clostridia bacterium]